MILIFKDLEIIKVSIPKPENEVNRENEDHIIQKDNESVLLLALSDGAGGYGAFSGNWAKTLLEKLPFEPLQTVEQMQKWIWQWGRSFYEIYSKQAKKSDLLLNKFYEQGSAATLVALWVFEQKNSLKANYLCYGDSILLGFDEQKKLIFLPPHLENLTAFDAFPLLINWVQNAKTLTDFAYSAIPLNLEKGQTWLMASDALAQTILVHYGFNGSINDLEKIRETRESNGKMAGLIQKIQNDLESDFCFQDWIDQLIENAKDEKKFTEKIAFWQQKGLIANDDCSLIALIIN